MSPALAVQTVHGDFPSGNSPEQADLSRLFLEEIGVEGPLEVSSSLYYSVIIQRVHFMKQREQLCPGLTFERKNPKQISQKTHQNHPHQKPTTHPLLKYLLYKDRGINRNIYPQNRMKCPFPLIGPSPSCCQTCKIRNKHRRVLNVTPEDETEQRFLPQVTNSSMGFLCTEGVFPLWLGHCFILLFLVTLITTIWSGKSFPQGLFQNHDTVLVSSLRKKETSMCVYVCMWMYFLIRALQVGGQRTGCSDCRGDEHRELRKSVTGTKMHVQSHH